MPGLASQRQKDKVTVRMTMTTESVKKAIDQYHSEGLSFFPIPAKSKEAAIPWKCYQEHQPTEEEIAHWRSNGTANIAIVCGAVSGNLVVLDFDSHDRFLNYCTLLQDKYGIDLFDYTRIVTTSRGNHVYFKLRNTIKSAKFPQIDVKAEGGYVMAPPSIHPSGIEYKCSNPSVPIRQIENLEEVGINVNQTETKLAGTAGNTGEIIPPGSQDAWLYSRACSYRAKGDDQALIIEKLSIDIKRCPQETGKRPYNSNDFKRIADSACKHPAGTSFNTNGNNSYLINTLSETKNSHQTFQNRDETVTESFQNADNGKRPNYSARFDSVLKEAGKMSRRDISLSISLQHTSDTFRQIVSRRLREGAIRPYRGSAEVLEWVNKDYKFLTLADYRKQTNLSITLPLGLNQYIKIPSGSVIGIAGYTSAGKTAFGLEIAELNVVSQELPVYHWFNEMSEERMLLRLEDYPNLVKELGGKFKAVKQTDFEFYDVIEPDAINIIDYLDLDGEGENNQVYMIGAVIKKCARPLRKGILIFLQQKKKDSETGYGGIYSAKLSNLYLSLDTVNQEDTRMIGKCKIFKAKDWNDVNPVGLYCNYYTGGKHGKIISDNVWRRDNA